MLQEPENPYEEWSFEIFTKDLSTAHNQCQAIANTGELTDVLNVSQRSKTLTGEVNIVLFADSDPR